MMSFASPQYKSFHCLGMIALLAVAVYANSFNGEFQFDDHEYIVKNAAIANIGDVQAIYSILPQPVRVIPFYTFALNYHFHELNVFGYHLTNLIIHIFNAWLVFMLIQLLFLTPRFTDHPLSLQARQIAFWSALFFTAHPIQTEAVSYITQRFTLIATFFYLLSVCLYLKGRMIEDKRRIGFLAGAFTVGLLGMLSKQIVLTLPLMICLLEFSCFRSVSELKQKKVYLSILLILLTALIIPSFYHFNWSIITRATISASHDGDVLKWHSYLLTQSRVIWVYLKLFVLPIGQNLDYDFAASKQLVEPKTFMAVLALFYVFVWAVYRYRRYPLEILCVLWFFLCLLVESSIIPIRHVIFEHRLYLPSVGAFLLMVLWLKKISPTPQRFKVVMSMLLIIFAVLTVQRNTIWQNPVSLWEDVVAKSPKKSRAHLNLALAYQDRRDYRKSMMAFIEAIKLNPKNMDAINLRGLLLAEQGLYALAIDDFNQALRVDSKFVPAITNRANVNRTLGKYDEAMADYNFALSISPGHVESYINRGNLHGKQRNFQLAIADFNRAIELNPNHLMAFRSRGNAYELTQQYDLALKDYEQVLTLRPSYYDVYINIGTVYARLNQYMKAILAYESVLEKNPQHADAYYKRSFAHHALGQYRAALEDVQKSKSLGKRVDPNYIARLEGLIAG